MSSTDKPFTASPDDAEIFQVSNSMAFFSWLICEHPGAWKKIAAIESSILSETIDSIKIDKPIRIKICFSYPNCYPLRKSNIINMSPLIETSHWYSELRGVSGGLIRFRD